MAFERNPWREFIGGGRGRPPQLLAAWLVALAVGCFGSMFWELGPVLDSLRLSPAVWEQGQIWRVVTYAFVGWGGVSPWTLIQLVLVYWFAMELIVWIGWPRVRVLLLSGVLIAGIAGVVVQLASDASGGPQTHSPFFLMQGQHVVIAIALAAFARCNQNATVTTPGFLLGLPVPVRWLVPLQLLYALAGFAATRDLGGLVGVGVATWWGFRVGATRG